MKNNPSLKSGEFGSMMGKLWSNMDYETKQQYIQEYEEMKEQF